MQIGNSGTPTSGYDGVYGFGAMQNYISFSYSANVPITVGAPVNLSYLNTSYINDSTYVTTPIAVNITEYGPVGTGFIAGNFTGILQGAIPPPGGTYNVTCSFRVRRRY